MGFHVLSKDYTESPLSIDEYLVRDRTSSYLLQVEGSAMERAAIREGDLVLVETSLPARDGSLVVACLAGEFVLRHYIKQRGAVILRADNPAYPPIQVRPEDDFTIFGVVTAVIRKLKA